MADAFTYFVYLGLLLSIMLLTCNAFLRQLRSSSLYPINYVQKLPVNYLAAILLISFVVGFRYEVGVDWSGYVSDFIDITQYQKQQFEWGYYYINLLVAMMGGSYEVVFFIVAFISWYFVFKGIPAALLPLTLFFFFADEVFFWSMNGVRQFVAIGIFIYAIRYIIDRKFLKYLILLAVAALFHLSALLLLPLYLVPFERIYSQRFWFAAFIVSFIIGNSQVIIDQIQLVLSYAFGSAVMYEHYLINIKSGALEAVQLKIGLGYYFKLLIFLLILFYSSAVVKKYPQSKIYFVLFFIGGIYFNLFWQVSYMNRFNNYFLFLRPLALAFVVIDLLKREKYPIISGGIIFLHFILLLFVIYGSSNQCSPFKFSFME